jgi:mono/diheme cytochrome c family protein
MDSSATTLVLLLCGALFGACGQDRPLAGTEQDAGATAPRMTTAEICGRTVYQRHCLFCHGARGRGDGLNAANLTRPPRDYGSFGEAPPSHEALRAVVTRGGARRGLSGDMPAFGLTLNEEQVEDVIAYVLHLSASPGEGDADGDAAR